MGVVMPGVSRIEIEVVFSNLSGHVRAVSVQDTLEAISK
jgi:hypothetical protein